MQRFKFFYLQILSSEALVIQRFTSGNIRSVNLCFFDFFSYTTFYIMYILSEINTYEFIFEKQTMVWIQWLDWYVYGLSSNIILMHFIYDGKRRRLVCVKKPLNLDTDFRFASRILWKFSKKCAAFLDFVLPCILYKNCSIARIFTGSEKQIESR